MITGEMRKIANKFIESVHSLKIYLFSSYAKDSFHTDSNYDFYLIVDDNAGNEFDIATEAYMSICKIGRKTPVDILVGHNSTFEERRTRQTIEKEVYATGVLLYAK